MDEDPIRALTGRRRTRPPSPGCRKPQQPKPGRTPLIAVYAAVQINRATSLFVEVPLVAGTGQPTPDLGGEALAELARPLAHGLVAHGDAAGRQHLFDHAQAERKAEVEPDGVADDLAWKAVAR